MTDSWEDWEDQDYNIPVLNIPNEEQLKRLEERKLVEESDNALTKDLFEEDLVYQDLKKIENKNIIKPLPSTEKKAPKKNVVNKQIINEQKQKAISKQIKEEKAKKLKGREIFGEADEDDEYDEYIEYEDKYC